VALYLVFDLGTSGAKSSLFDSSGNQVATRKEEWMAREPPGLEGIAREFDPTEVEFKLLSCATSVLKESRVAASEIKAVSTTSLRFGYVFLDHHDNVLYLGSNMDGRGIYVQEGIESKMGDRIHEATGIYPSLMSSLAKLLWFREKAPERYSKVAKVLNLNDWWEYKLSGVFATDASSASTTMLYDLAKGDWSDEVVSSFAIGEVALPEIRQSGALLGPMKPEFRAKLGLGMTDVVLGGPDTQCGLIGSGCTEEGDTGIVAGATAPSQQITRNPSGGSSRKVFVGAYMLPGKYVAETNAGLTGLVYQWAVRTFVGGGTDAYSTSEGMMAETGQSPTGINSFIGSQIMLLDKMYVLRPSVLTLPSPLLSPSTHEVGSILRAALEEVSYAVSCNLDILEAFTKGTSENLRLTGGMTRSRIFCETLSNVTKRKIGLSRLPEGTLLGTALCGMVGSGEFRDLETATIKIATPRETVSPDSALSNEYSESKGKWKGLYLSLLGLAEQGGL
jgi:autoinducer 2 (AI-2) kinase